MKRQAKVAGILLALSAGAAALMYKDAVGPFLASAATRILKTLVFGELADTTNRYVPGFYAFGAFVAAISGISPHDLVYWPIQLAPFVAVVFVLSRHLSRDIAFAALIVAVVTFSNIRGSRVLLYQHGMGSIALLLVYYAMLKYARSGDRRFLGVMLITAPTLIFISYNNTFRAIIVVLLFAGLLAVAQYCLQARELRGNAAAIGLIAVITGVVVLWSPWFHRTLLPQAMAAVGSNIALDVFLNRFLPAGGAGSPPVLKSVVANHPPAIAYLGILKYVILGVGGLVFGTWVLKRFRGGPDLLSEDLFVMATLAGAAAYFVARLFMGQFSYAVLFFPGVFALLVLRRAATTPVRRASIYSVGCCLLLISGGIFGLYQTNGLIERDDGHYQYVEPSADWYHEHGDGIVVTDVRTRYLFVEYISARLYEEGDRQADLRVNFGLTRVYSPWGFIGETLGYDREIPHQGRYVVINYRLDVVSLKGWADMRSWTRYEDQIMTNERYGRVYSDGDVSILWRA